MQRIYREMHGLDRQIDHHIAVAAAGCPERQQCATQGLIEQSVNERKRRQLVKQTPCHLEISLVKRGTSHF